jgi:hypothetical protein
MLGSDLQIPLWVKPASGVPSQKLGERTLEIPLWIKASPVNDLENYVSLPTHQIEFTKRLMRQRELDESNVCEAIATSGDEDTCSDDSTNFEECSLVSSDDYQSDIAEECCSEFFEGTTEDSSYFDPDDVHNMVAALRDARLRASARHAEATLDTTSDCLTKATMPWQYPGAVVPDSDDISILVASLRDARLRVSTCNA